MFKFAIRNLLTRPMRSLLALCGLTVAVAGMVGLFSVAEGIDSMVSSTFAKIPGLVVMQPGAPIPLFSRIPSAWGAEIAALDGVHVVSPEVLTRAHIINGKPTISPPRFLFGVDVHRLLKLRHGVYEEALQEGRFLTLADRGTWNAVISRPIADEFKIGVGDSLRVDGQELDIVGIYHCQSLLLDIAILCDIDHVRAMARMEPDTVSSFYVEPDLGADRDQLTARIKTQFRGRSVGAWQPASLLSQGLRGNSTGAAGDATAREARDGSGSTVETRNPVQSFFSTLHDALRRAAPPAKSGAAPSDPAQPPTASDMPPEGAKPPAERTDSAPAGTNARDATTESGDERAQKPRAGSTPVTAPAGAGLMAIRRAELPPGTPSPADLREDPTSAAPPAEAADVGAQGESAEGEGPASEAAAVNSSATELPIEVRSSDDWAVEFKRFSADLEIFLLIMTSIGMTIAVLGIINTMLMSVSERFIEFGILKANGWSNGSVLRLIAFESALLGVCGGVLGAGLGWGAAQLINANWPTRIHLYASPELLVFSLFFAALVGVLGGLYPAIWAARMMPMEAIRRG